jgi:hypothetical protein
MKYITSRGFILPISAEEMVDALWFNMWRSKQWPYNDLKVGDWLYWYESPSKSIVWRTAVVEVSKFVYQDKKVVECNLEERFGEFNKSQAYFLQAPPEGYCLAYKVLPTERVNYPRPEGFKFPYLGWLRVDEKVERELLAQDESSNVETLDEFATTGDLKERLHNLNEVMSSVLPLRVRTIVSQTIRRDTKLVRSLKSYYNYTCQFPKCGARIPKRNGGWYIEVAHIEAVAKGGKSVLGNLLVLCPNHHKEFDYGELEIVEQTQEIVRGRLNGKDFSIYSKL